MIRVPSSPEGAVTDHPNPSMAPDCRAACTSAVPTPTQGLWPAPTQAAAGGGTENPLAGPGYLLGCLLAGAAPAVAGLGAANAREELTPLLERGRIQQEGGIRSPATQLGGFSRRQRPGRELSARALSPVCQLAGRYPAAEGCASTPRVLLGALCLPGLRSPEAAYPGRSLSRRTRSRPPEDRGPKPSLVACPLLAAPGFLSIAGLAGPLRAARAEAPGERIEGSPRLGSPAAGQTRERRPATTFSQVLASPGRRRAAAARESPPKSPAHPYLGLGSGDSNPGLRRNWIYFCYNLPKRQTPKRRPAAP